MKVIIAVIRDIDEDQVTNQLVSSGFRVTRMSSTGGFLHRGNATLMIATGEEQLSTVQSLIQEACSAPDPGQNRAVLFVLNVRDFKAV
jgi:uncharacterized protein YaaQ